MTDNKTMPGKPHIVFVTTGDIEDIATSKRAFGMTEPLTALGYRVAILLQDTPTNRSRLAAEAPSAEPHWFSAGPALREMRLKRRLLRQLSPDIVYVGAFGIRNAVLPLRPSRALYLVEHSELLSAISNTSLKRRVTNFVLEWLAFKAFDGQVCASRYLEDYVRDRLPQNAAERVHYSPYAYSRSTLLPAGGGSRDGAAGRKKRILYMGTLARNYGIFHIMEAVDRMRRSDPGFECVVLGKGRHFDEAVGHARALDLGEAIDFRGYVPEEELPGYFSSTDVFVAPIFDTIQDKARCPSKMFMYVPFNRPVVTSAIGEARELFGADYPFYFEPDNVDEMAACLTAALETPEDWTPPWSADDHEWTARAIAFDSWIDKMSRMGASG
ncbi:MAG: glycosyltransferase family 4 protein [Pseudomonadota bacterium]|nr:glycosyltransferase family 4 protein [Pseudomonadota bacterium]